MGRNADAIARMQSARNNADYLPDCPFPTSLIATAELDDVLDRSEHLFLVVPSQALGETLRLDQAPTDTSSTAQSA